MNRVWVTGAAGFIGFHAARRLLTEGYAVIGIDNLNDYYDISLKEERLARLHGSAGFRFHRLDLSDRDGLLALMERTRPDAVIHLAAQAGVRYSLENPEAYVSSNLTGFANILECCRRHPVDHLLYASSSSVYGESASAPFSEEQSTDRPVSFYAATKKANEAMAFSYSRLYGIPATALRLFTVYGPWGRPDMAYFRFAGSILSGKPISVYNEGKMKRDFTYIDDAVEAIVRLLAKPPANRPPHRVLNVGNRHPVGLLDFIRLLERLLGREAVLEMKPMQPGDVPETCADTAALLRETGFEPDTPIEKGLSEFAEWYVGKYGDAGGI